MSIIQSFALTCVTTLLPYRLSAAAASKLRDKNPGITDLSDPNRPLKLSEKVSELYDNEWTNAMEYLDELGVQEDDGIQVLLKMFTVSSTCLHLC